MECPICLETTQDSFTSPCGHSYCTACYNKWKNEQLANCSSVTCPTCRFVIIKTPVFTIDIFAAPEGYVEREEDEVPFQSMPLVEYSLAIEMEYDEEEWCYDEEDRMSEVTLDSVDWNEKDDWEYEDVDDYLVSQVHAY